MMYSIHDNHDLQTATTVSPLLSSNNITISADNNINLLSSILVGQGNLNLTSTNGNVNMQSLQDLYYQYDFSQATSVDLGALIGVIVATIAIAVAAAAVTVFTLGAAGPAAIAGMAAAETGMIGALSAASVAGAAAGMTAITTATLTTAAVVASVGVGLQLGITAAIDHQNGGAAATKAMQSGHMDSTTKQYQGLVGNSLLFGGNLNVNSATPASVDQATQINANNINQTAQTNESASFKEEHKTIGPDWNKLMTDAAINGVVSGVTVAAGPLIEAGVSKLGSFVSDSFGLSKAGSDLASSAFTKSQFDDLALRQGINESNNVGLRLGNGMGDDARYQVALRTDQLMKDSRFTREFNNTTGEIHPVTKEPNIKHYGADIATDTDKTIHVAADGKVTEVRNQFNEKTGKGWGNTVKVEHYDDVGNITSATRYAHMKELPDLKAGQYVKEGDAVGQMGGTGGVKGDHLHYELEKYSQTTKIFERINPGYINPKTGIETSPIQNPGKYDKLSDIKQ